MDIQNQLSMNRGNVHSPFSSPLNICIAAQQFGQVISGPGIIARILINELTKGGHNVTVIAPESQYMTADQPFHFVSIPKPFFSGSQARWVSLSLAYAKEIRKIEIDHTFDIIHFTDAREALFCNSVSAKIGIINDTYAATLHPLSYYHKFYSDWILRWLYYRFVHICENWALPRLDAITAPSQYTVREVTTQYPRTKGKIELCYNSVSLDQFLPALERRSNFENKKHVVLFVGTNMQRKGINNLIQAAPHVIGKLPDVEFWIVGKDPVIPKLIKTCQDKGISQNFKFMGWKSQIELIDLYSQATVFVMPSIIEALGIAFLEAMAAGVPAIGTRVGGIPEIITDGWNGRLVYPNDPLELSNVLIELLQDLEQQKLYRQNGLASLDRFSVQKMVQCVYQVYHRVLQDRIQ